jgi:hypothetical protein
MPKYLFKGLDAASAPGPGPVLWFQSPRSFNDLAAQVVLTGPGPGATVRLNAVVEATINGSDFRPVIPAQSIFLAGTGTSNISSLFNLGPIGLMMGLRLNATTLDNDGGTPNATVLLAIDEKD